MLPEYRVLNGTAKECSLALNKLSKTHWLIVHKVHMGDTCVCVIVEITAERVSA